MATQLKASLLLQLEDKLSSGLGKLQKQLEELRGIAKTLGLTELEDSLDKLRSSAGSADTLTDGLRGIERQADRTSTAIKRLAQTANDNVIRVNSQGDAFGTGSLGSLALLPPGPLGGGGRRRGGSGDLDFDTGQLLLEGPPSEGGIPLNLRPRRRRRDNERAPGGGLNGLVGAGIEGAAVFEPIKAYAERDAELRQIGVMEGLQGDALEAEIRRLNTLVNTDALATGNTGKSIAEAYKDLLGQGLARSEVDGILRAHSEAATAYNIAPEILGPVTGSVVGNLGIKSGPEMEAALAALAAATQQGRVKMEDLARELPGLTGVAASLGMKGRQTLDTLAAGLEISAKTASDGTQAGVNFHDLLGYITSNREDNLTRKKLGLDLHALLLKGEREGKSPFDVYLDAIKKLTQGKSPVAQAQAISSIVTNQQARSALLALIQHNDEFERLRKTLSGINELKLKVDLASVLGSPEKQLANTQEALHQISLTLGKSFLPVLTLINHGLLDLNSFLTRMNTEHRKLTAAVLGTVGGLLAMAAALGAIGVVLPAISAGWGVIAAIFGALFTPIGLIIAAVAGLGLAAYELYKHWDQVGPFFAKLWEDAKGIFNSFLAWVVDWAGRIGGAITSGIATGFHNGVNGSIDLLEHLAPSGSGMERFLEHLKYAPQLQPPGGAAAGSSAGAALGAQVGGTIPVEGAPGPGGPAVRRSNPRVPLVAASAPSAGPVLSRH